MKLKSLWGLGLLCCMETAFAQVYQYRIEFTDKNNTPYSLSYPEAFLSQAAIDRRTQFQIPIDSLDIPVNRHYVNNLSQWGISVFATSKWMNSAVFRINDTSVLQELRKIPYVKQLTFLKIEQGSAPLRKLPSRTLKTSKSKSKKQAMAYDYGNSLGQIQMINVDSLHLLGFDGKGMTIAVIDGGFFMADSTTALDSLWKTGRVLGYRDFVDPSSDFFSQNWHGTGVLSTMGACQNGSMVGSAPQASYWLLRSEDVGSETWAEEDYWLTAAEYADSVGVWLINTSLGYSTFDYSQQNYTWDDLNGHTAFISRGASVASDKGMLVVVSMGNEGSKGWHYETVPGDVPNVLTVAAVNFDKQKSSFSGYGWGGTDYIKPDVTAQGEYVTVAVADQYFTSNGTSFSSPTICGAIACLWQAFPEFTSKEVIKAVKESGDRAQNPDSLYGCGIPDFMKAYRTLDSIYRAKHDTTDHDSTDYISIPNMVEEFCKIYPNPYADTFTIAFSTSISSPIFIELYDSNGKKVFSQKEKNILAGQSIDIRTSSPQHTGVYILKIEAGKHKYTQKLIKQ